MSSLIQKMKKNKAVQKSIATSERPQFISTGCYPLNILFSGRLKGGIPIGRISMMAAPSASGKSFIGLKVTRNAQKHHDLDVLYVDTEFAYDPNFCQAVGVDMDKFLPIQSNKIEEVQQIIASTIQDLDPEERKKVLVVIDSWGGLVTSKTMNDAVDGKDVTDMTIAKKKNSLARVLSGLGVTTFVVNHVYNTFSQYEADAISGGTGIIFASSCIVQGTSKAKDKGSDNEIRGAIITAKNYKGRFAVEHSKLKFLIKYEGGISKYYGLLDVALEGGFITKPSMGWYSRSCIDDDKKWREKEIWDNAEEFWEPVIQSDDFNYFIEKRFSFDHNLINNGDLTTITPSNDEKTTEEATLEEII